MTDYSLQSTAQLSRVPHSNLLITLSPSVLFCSVLFRLFLAPRLASRTILVYTIGYSEWLSEKALRYWVYEYLTLPT